jgi:hypothetical protein
MYAHKQAAWALGLKGDSRAVEPLRNVLNDPDVNVRKQARWALDLREMKLGRRIKIKNRDINVDGDVDVDVDVDPKVEIDPNVKVKVKTKDGL